jgi:hypothetical protein
MKRSAESGCRLSGLAAATDALSATDLDTKMDSGLVEHMQEDGLNYRAPTVATPISKGNAPRSFGSFHAENPT